MGSYRSKLNAVSITTRLSSAQEQSGTEGMDVTFTVYVPTRMEQYEAMAELKACESVLV